MSFDDGVKACRGVGGKIIMVKDRKESASLKNSIALNSSIQQEISEWVDHTFYINARRIHPDSDYFYYPEYPPKYT